MSGSSWSDGPAESSRVDGRKSSSCPEPVQPNIFRIAGLWFYLDDETPEQDRVAFWNLWSQSHISAKDIPEELLEYRGEAPFADPYENCDGLPGGL